MTPHKMKNPRPGKIRDEGAKRHGKDTQPGGSGKPGIDIFSEADDRPERSREWQDEIERPAQLSKPTGRELPQFLKDLIACPPEHGAGVHQWLFRCARQLHAHRTEDEICDLLAAAVHGCGRPVPQSEIAEAVSNSRAVAWRPDGGTGSTATRTRPKWPEPDQKRIAEIERQDPFALLRLEESSPVRVSPKLHDADCLLDRLFPADPLLCVAQGHPSTAKTLRRSELEDAGRFSHLVPSPMTATTGQNQQGKPTARCLANTGPRQYLITEFDEGDHGQQCAIIRHLARFAPLTAVVNSAGKSLHAWWHCARVDESAIKRFFRYAVRLGADPATWARCQLVRMPLGFRPEKNKLQRVAYFDHRNTQTRKGPSK